MMDSRHQVPILSVSIRLDWSNPLFVAFVGFMGLILALVVLAIV